MSEENFSLQKSISILKNTPFVIEKILSGLSDDWIYAKDGEDGWSPFDILGHLIHADLTNWIIRANVFLSESADRTFPSFSRDDMLEKNKGVSLKSLISEFKNVRSQKIQNLDDLMISESDLDLEAIHPAQGPVKLRQLISTWVVHDLSHLAHMLRAMAKHYTGEVGPWREYLTILKY